MFAIWLRKKHGVIRDHTCFHAPGPHYAAQYGHLDREIAKYAADGLHELVTAYEDRRDAAPTTETDPTR